jgi:hypothetical protein
MLLMMQKESMKAISLHKTMNELKNNLRKVVRRLYIAEIIKSNCASTLFALILSALALIVYKFYQFPVFNYLWIIGIIILFSIIGTVYSLFKKITLMDAAKLTDENLNLKERISSAIEFEDKKDESPFVPQLILDAIAHKNKILPEKIVRFIPPYKLRYLFIALTVVISLFFVPNIHWSHPKPDKQVVDVIHKEAKKIEKIAKDLEKKANEDKSEEINKISKEMMKISDELKKKEIDKKEALKKISKLAERLEAMEKEKTKSTPNENIKESIEKLAQNEFTKHIAEDINKSNFENIKEKIDDMIDKLKEGNLSDSQRKELAEGLKQMGEAFDNLGLPKVGDEMKKAGESVEQKKDDKAIEHLENAKSELPSSDEIKKQMALKEGLQKAQEQLQMSKQEIADAENKTLAQSGGIDDYQQNGETSKDNQIIDGQGNQNQGNKEQGTQGQGTTGTPDAGTSSTNLDEGNKGNEGNVSTYNRQTDGNTGKTGEFVKLYDPTKLEGTQTKNTQVKGNIDGKGNMPYTDVDGKPVAQSAYTPYDNVYSSYEKTAEEALNKEEIPKGYKKYVKDYFESIKPKK